MRLRAILDKKNTSEFFFLIAGIHETTVLIAGSSGSLARVYLLHMTAGPFDSRTAEQNSKCRGRHLYEMRGAVRWHWWQPEILMVR